MRRPHGWLLYLQLGGCDVQICPVARIDTARDGQPPVNVLRLSLHPRGFAPQIANLTEWRSHLLERLRHQIDLTADPVLSELMRELRGYPAPDDAETHKGGRDTRDFAGVVVPLRLVTEQGVLSFISTTTVFGTPIEVTLSELAIEAFFPADAITGEVLRRLGSA